MVILSQFPPNGPTKKLERWLHYAEFICPDWPVRSSFKRTALYQRPCQVKRLLDWTVKTTHGKAKQQSRLAFLSIQYVLLPRNPILNGIKGRKYCFSRNRLAYNLVHTYDLQPCILLYAALLLKATSTVYNTDCIVFCAPVLISDDECDVIPDSVHESSLSPGK